jgi:hypothetical protein
MRILVWNVHGGWMDAFVRGLHEYVIPVDELGNGGRMDPLWPSNAIEVAESDLREQYFDVVIVQRPEQVELAERLLGRRVGRDVPAIYVEHNTPTNNVPESRHPFANRDDLLIAHVTHFNEVFWDCGETRTVTIEHGVVDRGYRYSGELARAAVVINEPVRRWRVTGSDLLGRFSRVAPVDVFGMGADGLSDRLRVPSDLVTSVGNFGMDELHDEIALRRFYLHPNRWTSLGLSLLDAMHAGMPVVALGATEAARSVPREAGIVSTDLEELEDAMRTYLSDADEAVAAGRLARVYALEHHGLSRFLQDWDAVLREWTSGQAPNERLSARTALLAGSSSS